MKRRIALVSAGVAAGLVTAGVIGREVLKRRGPDAAPIGDLPPEDLGPVTSFDGTELAVRAAGDPSAPILVFSHGFSLDMSEWCDLWPDLARDFRVVAFDHRSHGRSAAAAHGDLSLRSMGRDTAAVLELVAPDRPAVVIGHSMGAMAILAMAEQRPELISSRVAGVVMIGAASSDLLRGAMGSVTELLRPRLGSARAAARRVDRLRRAVLASPVDVSGVVTRVTQFGPEAPHRVVDHVVALAHATASEVWTDALPELMEMDLRHAVPRIHVPALVVVGELDRVTPPAAAIELAGALPDGRLVVLDGVGHIPMLERPLELEREIRSFARGVFAPARGPKRRTRRKPPQGDEEVGAA
ncbi:MAG TPA: alpha/beta hydrolase [Actinomycetota bacterium]